MGARARPGERADRVVSSPGGLDVAVERYLPFLVHSLLDRKRLHPIVVGLAPMRTVTWISCTYEILPGDAYKSFSPPRTSSKFELD